MDLQRDGRKVSPTTADNIDFLSHFKTDIEAHFHGSADQDLRARINRRMRRARELILEAGAMKTVTLSPPPAIGGLMIRNADPFNFILQDYYGISMVPAVCDMIDEAIGVFEDPEYESRAKPVAFPPPPQAPGASEQFKKEAELPDRITLAWLIRNVPVSFWLWFGGIIAAAFVFGAKVGSILLR